MSSPKKLKLGFAMGGGVSLGTFNGSALTQSLKLLIAYSDYEQIELDVFSGASAGALALGSMMSGLLARNYTEEQRNTATEAMATDEFSDVFANLSPTKQEQLVDAHLLQQAQEKIWGEDVNLNKLLRVGDKENQDKLKFKASILDRGAVDEIAASILEETQSDRGLNPSSLAGDRLLFNCTLTNMTPVIDDAREAFNAPDSPSSDISRKTLNDALTSFRHKEARVFDIHLSPIPNETLNDKTHPKRWMRYHLGDKINTELRDGEVLNKGAFDLRERSSWSDIFSTMIACGAFPFAFEPVSLKRHRFEYSEETWKSTFPEDRNSAVVTYMDGGALNNEPVREAFRMASFLDANEDDSDFDRRIIFVDPAISKLESTRDLTALRDMSLNEQMFTFVGRKKTSLDKLPAHLLATLGAIKGQSRSQEADNYIHIRNQFEERDLVRDFYRDKLTAEVEDYQSLRDYCAKALEKDRKNHLFPANSVSLAIEIQRILYEEKGKIASLELITAETVEKIEKNTFAATEATILPVFKVLSFLAFDILLDLSGKRRNAQLIGIGPIDEQGQPTPLPGGELFGFAGFTSKRPSNYEFAMGRYASQYFLSEVGLLPGAGENEFPGKFSEITHYKKDFEDGMRHLSQRIELMITESNLKKDQGFVPEIVLQAIASKIEKAVANLKIYETKLPSYQLYIKVPSKKFEIDTDTGSDKDVKAHLTPQGHEILIEVNYDWDNKKWVDDKQILNGQQIRMDRNRLFDDDHIHITLPEHTLVQSLKKFHTPVFRCEVQKEDGDYTVTDWRIEDSVKPLVL